MANVIQRTNFRLKSDMSKIARRDFPLATPAYANPLNAAAFIDGEWVYKNDAGKIARACDITQAAGTVSDKHDPMPIWAERGRTDVQATYDKKMPCLFQGEYEAYTRVYDSSLGGTISAVGQPLKVAVVEIIDSAGTTRKYSGLMRHAGVADTDPIVGYVTELPAAANSYQLKFKSGGRR